MRAAYSSACSFSLDSLFAEALSIIISFTSSSVIRPSSFLSTLFIKLISVKTNIEKMASTKRQESVSFLGGDGVVLDSCFSAYSNIISIDLRLK